MKRYSLHLHQPLTPSNVAITVGASQALYLSLRTIVTPGSEVIIFEPFFDLYVNQVKVCGGKPRFVPLKFEGGRWNVDEDEVRGERERKRERKRKRGGWGRRERRREFASF